MNKLKLNKEVIAQLTDDSMNSVQGGDAMLTHTQTCPHTTWCTANGPCQSEGCDPNKSDGQCNIKYTEQSCTVQ